MIERYLDGHRCDVLEIGCGEGRVSALLAPRSRTYIAIDPDPDRIGHARSSFPEVDFRIGNGEALDFPDASFNRVLYTLSLHHQESRVALREAHRVLTGAGRVVIVEPAADGEFQQFFHLFDDETERLNEAMKAISQSDFKLEHQERFNTGVTFHDHEELCSYPFDRTEHRPDDRNRILELLRRLRGPLTEGQPVRLQDKLHLYSIQK
ncbi:MAG: class I SAM-dependent methyltransferase [Desulfobacteraceae bacterium]|nr:class I SAM-dependent methyltransferase [Desulfobacteraceae bacterium]